MVICDPQWEYERLLKVKALIEAIDDAILAVTVGGVLEYSLNTGQSIQRVTRQDVARLTDARRALFQQYDSLCARLTNGGAIQVIPGNLP